MREPLPGAPSEPDFVDPLECYDPPKFKDDIERHLAETSVAALKTWPFATIEAHRSVRDGVASMAQQKIACLLVTDANQLVGLFTERDVLNKLSDCFEEWCDRPVREFMTTDPLSVLDVEPVATAICVLAVQGYRHVPVLDVDNSPVGVLSPNRILSFLRRRLED